jgi:hypothetical protein
MVTDESLQPLSKRVLSMATNKTRKPTAAERRKVRELKRERFLDEIKDEIDELNRIRSVKQRREAASDLIDYINLHYIDALTR